MDMLEADRPGLHLIVSRLYRALALSGISRCNKIFVLGASSLLFAICPLCFSCSYRGQRSYCAQRNAIRGLLYHDSAHSATNSIPVRPVPGSQPGVSLAGVVQPD